jgi:DNA-binding NtrC family response regulator
MSREPQALLLSHNARNRANIRSALTACGWHVRECDAISRLPNVIGDSWEGVVVADYGLPDGTWRNALLLIRTLSPASEVVVASHIADERMWAEVLNLGAFDLLPAPAEQRELLRVAESAWREYTRKVTPRAEAVPDGGCGPRMTLSPRPARPLLPALPR